MDRIQHIIENFPKVLPQDTEQLIQLNSGVFIFNKTEAVLAERKWHKPENICTIKHKGIDIKHPGFRWNSGGCIWFFNDQKTTCPRCNQPKKIYRYGHDPGDYCDDCRKQLNWVPGEVAKKARAFAASYVLKYKQHLQYRCELSGITYPSEFFQVHHKHSINTYPEMAHLYENMVGLYDSIHSLFHSIYGRGNNTPYQFYQFINEIL